MNTKLLSKKSKYRSVTVAGFLLIGLNIQISYAEMFKWVDEQGNIHYSDKQPESDTHDSEKIASEEPPEQIANRKANLKTAIALPHGKLSHKILIPEIHYRWNRSSTSPTPLKLGAYFAGRLCSPRGPIKSPDIYATHPSFLPGGLSLSRAVNRVIKELGFDSSIVLNQNKLLRRLGDDVLELRGEIELIDIQACAALKNSLSYIDAREINAFNFKKNRVKLSVSWQLYQGKNRKLIFEARSEGYFDARRSKNSVPTTVSKAVDNATTNLFANEQLVSLLSISSGASRMTAEETSKPEDDQSWMAPLNQFFPFLQNDGDANSIQRKVYANTILQSQVASVLAEVNSVKVMMIQMYMQDQKWPLSKDEIGLSDAMFTTHKLIDDLKIGYDGSIRVELKAKVFGNNKTLHLTPDTDAFENGQSMNINWTCLSNLDAAVLPGVCKAI